MAKRKKTLERWKPGIGLVIGIMSFKGGVGKTTTAINLAAGLKTLGKEVLVIDGNFLSPNLHFYMGLLNPEVTLKEILRKKLIPESGIYEHASGIHILPCNFYQNIDLKKFSSMIKNLKKKYDYILLDSGPSYTGEVIAILMVSDEIIVLTTPDYPSLASTLKVTNLLHHKNLSIKGIIINRRKKKRFELSSRDIEKATGVNVLGEIPEDNKLLKSVKDFYPVVFKYRRSKSSKAFLKVAKELAS